jgi:hypothetical protein
VPLRAAPLLLALALPAQLPPEPPPDPTTQPDPTTEPPAAVAYSAPVLAPVVAPFDPPATPYGPGNRGIELATSAGQEVRAAAAGTVTFAGWVAGELYVTVLHADRVRTTYGRLASSAVQTGSRVTAGAPVGTATTRFIWTARMGAAYLDPAVLLAASGRPMVRLVPDRPGAPPSRSEPVPATAAGWALEPRRP